MTDNNISKELSFAKMQFRRPRCASRNSKSRIKRFFPCSSINNFSSKNTDSEVTLSLHEGNILEKVSLGFFICNCVQRVKR